MRNKEKKAEKVSSLKTVFATMKYFFPEAFHYKPFYFVLWVINIIATACKPFIDIIFPALIVNELLTVISNGAATSQNITTIVIYIGVTVLGNFAFSYISSVAGVIMEKYDDYFKNYFAEKISMRAMEMDFALTENKDALDQVEKAKTGMDWYSGGVHGLMTALQSVVSGFITLVGTVALLAAGAPWLLLICTVMLIGDAIINSRHNKAEIKAYTTMAKQNRVFGYILFGLSDFRYGKDLRLYHSTEMMTEKAKRESKKQVNEWHSLANIHTILGEMGITLGAIRDGVTYFYLGFLAITRAITIGDFTMYMGSVASFNFSLQAVVFGYQDVVKRCTYAREYVKFMEYPPYMRDGAKPLPQVKEHTIEFRNVFFKYPNTDIYILKGINITLKQGEHLSVVGLNGAGKTTFIKLLCRLYDVDEGEILLDGVNITEYKYEEYVKLFSVVFQDFRLFAFSIKDNILLENADEPDASARAEELVDMVGLREKINSLPDGTDTMLFKQFDEKGIEPSGGEQQKIAIARALYKNSPVIILDEPTAALDPMAEYEIYRQFDTLVGGKTAVYISHRLSSCKFCDRIVVFSDGVIKESGTHDELVSLKDGIYAEMFGAQAQYYVNN